METEFNSVAGPIYPFYFFNDLVINPMVLLLILIIVVMYYIFFTSIGKEVVSEGVTATIESGKMEMGNLDVLLWSVLLFLVIINAVTYFNNMTIDTKMRNVFTDEPEIDVIVNPSEQEMSDIEPVPEIKIGKQVFNIPENDYTYNDAKALCKAYGGRLAKYEEISDAYEKGADWCNYGWSEDQMALFPTQLEKWQKLQKIEGHKHDCGRPGINGGYIKNKNVKFGVNCYGYKPKITGEEAMLMQTKDLFPKTEKDIMFERKVNYWRNRLTNILVSPFNNKNWSMF